LSSVQIAIVIVASDLRIRRFTPMAERVLNLIPGDISGPSPTSSRTSTVPSSSGSSTR
jgi:two-component system CheB/CheR fusion protein